MQKQSDAIFKGKTMKLILITILTVFNLNASANCPINFETTQLCAKLEWTKGPLLNEKSHFKVTFWNVADESETPVSPNYEVDIYSWMIMDNGHNHGGPALTYIEKNPGEFISKDARFFMGRMKGSWQIKIELIGNSKSIVKAVDVDFN